MDICASMLSVELLYSFSVLVLVILVPRGTKCFNSKEEVLNDSLDHSLLTTKLLGSQVAAGLEWQVRTA